MSPWAILAALLLVGSMTGGAYFQGRKDGEARIVAQEAREQELAQKATDAALIATAEAIAKIKVKHQTITNEVQHEVSERVVYRDCAHTPNGLQLINAALTGSKAQPASGVGLP